MVEIYRNGDVIRVRGAENGSRRLPELAETLGQAIAECPDVILDRLRRELASFRQCRRSNGQSAPNSRPHRRRG